VGASADQGTADRSWLAETILSFRVVRCMAAGLTVLRGSSLQRRIKGGVAIAAPQ
jgi:hypothetical protein